MVRKIRKKQKKILLSFAAMVLVGSLTLSVVLPEFDSVKNALADGDGITRLDDLGANLSDYFDSSVVQALPDTVASDQDVSVIVEMNTDALIDVYEDAGAASIGEYAVSAAGKRLVAGIERKRAELLSAVSKAGISFELGNSYDVLIGGFEITVKAKDFKKLADLLDDKATLIVGEVYEKCATEIVENDVNVYDTGIFNSSDTGYDGSGTLIAVLDTGLDYTHTAFDPVRFEGKENLTVSGISGFISQTRAASFTSDLSAEDVYLNKKVPYAYDYADKDPDVYPIESEHGTHVSGIIVGNDDTITGVAPNAQLVSMKVFSDTTDGAKTSWILAALEDCAIIGVDVINMSLGSAAGFSREVDETEVNRIYDKIGAQGISLICAASNSYNSTFGSAKNGNLGLTSNPDSGTVGSPSTYEAALSVASVSGVKKPYLMYNGTVVYFTESTNKSAKTKNFVDEILPEGVSEKTFDYVTIPGIGRTADYTGMNVQGKIALVKRGSTTFEEKARIAQAQGALGVIIYNNVSGDIAMTVGNVDIAVCSISQDNGELLAAQETGKISISRSQTAGPFMSDFSSWGPTPDLRIKPEITAHGGEILSSVPGQSYDRLSGTSMAAPNQAGITALIRQYVKETFPSLSPTEVTARVNQIMMSTTDIVYNTNGLPYAVRKQGAGLANITKATTTPAFLSTIDADGEIMDKAKLELGDDPEKTGVYSMKVVVNNIGSTSLSYKVNAVVLTEGVSETLTNQGETTVTEQGYLLNPTVTVTGVGAGGSNSGNVVTVAAGQSAVVTVEIRLSDADKEYLDKSFENGMYVEGFLTLEADGGTQIGLNVPFLAFYGDWTQAPLFDLDYFATNKDELDDSIDLLDKTLPDAYATRPIGGLYSDYIAYLGSYAYIQDPSAVKISADRKYIALSNQSTGESGSTVHSIYGIWAGMLRGAKRVVATVTDTTTGEVVYEQEVYNQRKSFNYGSSIVASTIEMDFDLANYNLKNNTQYLVKLQGYLDYGDGGLTTNLNNTFEFPFVTDFEAPSVTGCDFYTEYDATEKKTRLFVNIDIYDNHYSQAAYMGYITESETGYALNGFDRYLSALYSDFNSTYTLTYELTDHLDEIKSSYNGNSFVVEVIDYAQNTAVYEIAIPDSVASVYFTDAKSERIESLTLSPNETYAINAVVFPETSWAQSLNYSSSDESVARVVNGKIVAVAPGTVTITATSNADPEVSAALAVTVLSEGEEGYVRYDKPVADFFKLTSYTVEKVFYFTSSSERDLGATEAGVDIKFAGSSYALSMYPSESVTVNYNLAAYFPEETTVQFVSSNSQIVTVDENGTITAVSEGNASIAIRVLLNGKTTYYSQTISISVKDPFTTSSIYLLKYTGNGGVVEIPADLSVTEISQYAFSNYQYVPKDETDEISEEDPYTVKIAPIGENTITKVVIPEGVETIGRYAFAYLTALEEVVLPSTLKKIDLAAFIGCTSLIKINLKDVQFINKQAFKDCPLNEINLSSIIAIGDEAFSGDELGNLFLPASAQSIGARAFYGNTFLQGVQINAEKVKLGSEAFAGCTALSSVDINASVIPAGVFDGCSSLKNVTLGKDVSVVGAFAFRGTKVSSFDVASDNVAGLSAGADGTCLLADGGTRLVLVAPNVSNFSPSTAEANRITTIGDSAFSGNTLLMKVDLPNATRIGNYAFAGCSVLTSTGLRLGKLTEIGDYAFYGCSSLTTAPSLEDVPVIGSFAFFGSGIVSVEIFDDTVVGTYAFAACAALRDVTVGDGVVLESGAFYAPLTQSTLAQMPDPYGAYYVAVYAHATSLNTLTIGENVAIGDYAFYGSSALTSLTIGSGAVIGAYAFFDAWSLEEVDLSQVKAIGVRAFSGYEQNLYYYTGTGSPIYAGVLGSYAAALTRIDLSACTSLGDGAFAGATSLTEAVLGDGITEIGNSVFYLCFSLEDINFENITKIGQSAFTYANSLTEIDLSGVDSIGAEAFSGASGLTSVVLKEGVTIGEKAFYQAEALASINLGVAAKIGEYAFSEAVLLTEADLTSAVYVGEYAFMDSGVVSVVFGTQLGYLGDNPFAGCLIGEFTDGEGNTDFEIGDAAFVSDGVLYSVASNGGFVLVSYPLLKTTEIYAVEAGTIRIGGRAFAGSAVRSVELPLELKAVGDKAFYSCDDLFVVVFKSVAAPILEEEYDQNYQLYTNLPQTGTINGTTYEGLGVVPFKMWNISATIFYYGANFINYVGVQNSPLVMVRPSNGTGYENFIYNKYFTARVDGAVAPYQETLDAIAIIAALPDYITLSNEAQVAAARAAYDRIALTEQQALVTNLDKLTSAERTIEYLKGIGGGDPTPVEPVNPIDSDSFNYKPVIVTLSVLTGVFAVTTIAAGVLLILTKKKKD